MKKFTMIILGLLTVIVLVIGLFLWFIAYAKTTDVSQDVRFKAFLNKPLIVKQSAGLMRSAENSNRFSAYYIDIAHEDAQVTTNGILKKYQIGDTISFTAAKKYSSNNVGDTYYLLGNETLDSGELIVFEYGLSLEYMPAIWETLDAFLERRALENDAP